MHLRGYDAPGEGTRNVRGQDAFFFLSGREIGASFLGGGSQCSMRF